MDAFESAAIRTGEQHLELFSAAISVMTGRGCIATQPRPAIPIIAFEGLPAAGKTTQLDHCSRKLKASGLRVGQVEVPNRGNPFGEYLHGLYTQPRQFRDLEQALPWMNPALVVADILDEIRNLRDIDLILMSRGPLSTFVYHADLFRSVFGSGTSSLENLVSLLPQPDLLLFFDVDPGTALERIERRTRPKRPRDSAAALTSMARTFNDALARFSWGRQLVRIDAAAPLEQVSAVSMDAIMEITPSIRPSG